MVALTILTRCIRYPQRPHHHHLGSPSGAPCVADSLPGHAMTTSQGCTIHLRHPTTTLSPRQHVCYMPTAPPPPLITWSCTMMTSWGYTVCLGHQGRLPHTPISTFSPSHPQWPHYYAHIPGTQNVCWLCFCIMMPPSALDRGYS
jgi:hypothetical protein